MAARHRLETRLMSDFDLCQQMGWTLDELRALSIGEREVLGQMMKARSQAVKSKRRKK